MNAKGRTWPSEITESIDEQTGARLWQVTRHAGSNHHLYFLTDSFLPDERSLVFARFRDGRSNFYRAGFPAGNVLQLTDGEGINSVSAVITEDGSRLLFVSGKTGAPELWELDNDHAAVQRTDRTRDPIPFPTGPSAPIWDRNTIAFEDNEGVRILSVDPPRLLRTVPGTLPLLSTRSRAFVVQDPAGLGPRWVSFDATEVVR